ncbi:MAG: 2-oxoglutarate dehydrogenase complex dihydrolipoyllysine-residue succinyltransferase [Lentisphaeraceae bacterium]|nr:2-oxoglutarate dehydrogenase complex dihydrolipoyllysine-residue succinyltransferase [Lentisphaeraceae bacterium]
MIIDIVVPKAGESVTEADIASWMKEDGDFVQMDEAILELETDKASMELAAEAAGQLKVLVAEGETVQVGEVIGQIDTSASGSAAPAKKEEKKAESAPVAEAKPTPTPEPAKEETVTVAEINNMNQKIPSPAARKIILENGLSVQDVPATGKGGRITKTDVLEYLKLREQQLKIPSPIKTEAAPVETSPKAPAPKAPVAQTADSARGTRVERMSRLRRTVAERLVEAQKTAAILTTFNEVDMSAIMDLRKKYKEKFKEKYEVGLGFMSFFTKACCMALKDHPVINAQVDGNNIIYHDYCDIGVAVSTPKGLVVPIVRDAQDMSFEKIEKRIIELAIKGRNADLTPDEMSGGTFTITNGGIFGSMLSTPILNRPQSAILGMHNIIQKPVVVDGEIVIRPMMYLALSYDHRIIDGADAVRFLVKVKECIEDPTRILLDL